MCQFFLQFLKVSLYSKITVTTYFNDCEYLLGFRILLLCMVMHRMEQQALNSYICSQDALVPGEETIQWSLLLTYRIIWIFFFPGESPHFYLVMLTWLRSAVSSTKYMPNITQMERNGYQHFAESFFSIPNAGKDK